MKMEDMVKDLAHRGFEVTKQYRGDSAEYKFTISRGGLASTSWFKYNPYISAVERDKQQRSFLENLVKQFYADWGNACVTYSERDVISTRNIYNRLSLEIKKVVFNDPATIVLWKDGTKTVVKCGPNDIYDPEKGLAMAISKKALGNKGNYLNTFKKWLPKEEESSDV